MDKITVKLTRVNPNSKMPTPQYATEGSAGVDLAADIQKKITLRSGASTLIPTGIIIALPQGTEAQIRPRSGLAINFGITVLNSPGTIDSDYRGEIKIILINHGKEDFIIKKGMRIAQMVISSYKTVIFKKVVSLDSTARNTGRFGSTGI